jgi:predicted dehydrogenase
MTDQGAIRFGVAGMTSDHVWEMGDGLAALAGVELVAGADPHPELTERAAGRWGLGATYADHRAMVAAERLDAVLVCCDNAAKADVVEAAAERRVHVYQDKPMAATLAQADRIARAAAGVRDHADGRLPHGVPGDLR